MPPRTPRLPPPDRCTLFVCRTCGAWALAPEEIFHNSKRCPGRTDAAHIDRVTAAAVASEPLGSDPASAAAAPTSTADVKGAARGRHGPPAPPGR